MKKLACTALAAALALSLGVGALADAHISDVHESQWFYAPVSEMVAAGFIDGYEDGSFKPDRNVSVAEFVTMTARCLGLETGSSGGHWAGVQMGNAYSAGWLSEFDVAKTGFDQPVSRQLAAKILAVALSLKLTDDIPYSDAANVGQSYVTYVGALCAAGLLDGFEDNTIRPAAVLTRAQAATLIYRATGAASVERVTAAPDGEAFVRGLYLDGYDNPNFSVTLKGGVASVDISYAELWTDVADINSPIQEEAAEARRRAEITEAMSRTRVIPTGSPVTAVYELPCTTWFPGSDARAIIATEDGRWYAVDLSGQNNHGVPECKEITVLRGQDVSALYWRTTSWTEGYTSYSGTDCVVARIGNAEDLVWTQG